MSSNKRYCVDLVCKCFSSWHCSAAGTFVWPRHPQHGEEGSPQGQCQLFRSWDFIVHGSSWHFFLLACCQAATTGIRSRSALSAHAVNTEFRGTSYLGPLAARLEQHVQFPKMPSFLLSHWDIVNVAGDGRCGRRSLAAFLGLSWQHVLRRLLASMLATNRFASSHIIEMMAVQDPSNARPQSCWLNSRRITLIFAQTALLIPMPVFPPARHVCWGS